MRVKLAMAHYLDMVDKHGVAAHDALIGQGYPAKLIWAKAEKAARKGYTDYGVAPDRGWLTDDGRSFLAGHRQDDGRETT